MQLPSMRLHALMQNSLRQPPAANADFRAKSPVRSIGIWKSFWIAIAFAAILSTTRAVELGDTQDYASDIADHLGKSPFGPANSLWEFGHLLWRPAGWLLATIAAPILSTLTDWTPVMQASFCLILISIACSIITVILWYQLLIDVTRSSIAASLIALAVSCSHGFLLYAHSGCAYIPGLMFLTASVWLIRRDCIGAGAISYALATLVWLPFILAGAGLLIVVALPSAWETPLKDSFRSIRPARAIRFAAISASCVVIVFGLALAARRISSIDKASSWYSESQHGWSQSIRAVRIATGLPRAFLYLGKDGVLYRRYLSHDPYAPVAMGDLVKASLWKIVAFDLFLAAFLYELLRRAQSGWPLLLFLAGAVPVVFFAVFLFEPGSPERYLPAFPFLILALGWILRDFWPNRRVTQVVVAGFLLCVVLTNGYSFYAPRVSRENGEALRRIAGLRNRFAGTGIAVVVTNQDPIEDMINRSTFGAINRPSTFPIYDAVEPATLRVLQWREEFAARALKVWKAGGEVWISKRAWNVRPRPEWNWVEGDDKRVTWGGMVQFFSVLQTDADLGGEDGFSRLTRNDSNQAVLTPFASAYREPQSVKKKE